MATIRRRIVWSTEDGQRFFSEEAVERYKAEHPGAAIKEKNLGWEAIVRRRGHKPVSKTFPKKAMAERWAGKQEEDMASGAFVDARSAEKTTIKQILEKYKTDITAKKADSNTESFRIATLIEKLGHFTGLSLKAADVVDYAVERLKTVSSDAVRRELTILSDAITTAQALWQIAIPVNPVHTAKTMMQKTRTLKPGKRRSRRLLTGEEDALMKAPIRHLGKPNPVRQRKNKTSKTLQPNLIKEIVTFAIETALRRSEIARTRREHINWKACTLLVPESKTDWKTGDEGRIIPLSPKAIEILKQIPARINGEVWGVKPASISQAFDRIAERARKAYEDKCKAYGMTPDPLMLVDLRFHDLRHEATSRLFEQGYSIEEVATITGHKDWKSLKGYTHLKPEELAAKLAANDHD